MSKHITHLLIVVLALIVIGCAPAASKEAGEAQGAGAVAGGVTAEVAGDEAELAAGVAGDKAESAAEEPVAGPVEVIPDSEAGARVDSAAAESFAPMPMATAGVLPQNVLPPVADEQFQPELQAGEIDDNADFSAFLQYQLDYLRFSSMPVRQVDVSERHIIRVTTTGGAPVLGAEVLIYEGQTLLTTLRTTASGTAYFFPRAYTAGRDPFTVLVRKGQSGEELRITREKTDATWPVTLSVRPTQPPVNLDVLFLIDATGSMGPQIDQLKNNMLSISAQVAALPSRPNFRFGMVSYRDRGDDYVTRVTDFTSNVQAFQQALMEVYAAGGGDTPEAMDAALHDGLTKVSWRVDDTVSLIILVADAPPHIDEPGYAQDFSYAVEMQRAAALGVKIYPIIANTGNVENYYRNQAEFVYRQLAQFTGGHFIFITSEETPQSSGEPGTDLSVQEGYSVENLDALVVRLIQQELEALMGQ